MSELNNHSKNPVKFSAVSFFFKNDAKDQKTETQILGAFGYSQYFILSNLKQFLDIIKAEKQSGGPVRFFEHTPDDVPVNMFFDLDIKKKESPQEWEEHKKVVEEVKSKTRELFDNYRCHFQVLESHETNQGKEKASYHIIVKLHDSLGNHVYLKNILVAKAIAEMGFSSLIKRKVIDAKVYGDRIFRTIYSSKPKENRPLLQSKDLSDEPINEIESLLLIVLELQYAFF